ncbi:MAG: pyruvate dehydrogenase [Solirubrobacterales bacterium]|nr:pyruvate dehydrogenase [Solirubrobacterales bacterium]
MIRRVLGETVDVATARRGGGAVSAVDPAALELIQARVLWLATAIVDHANRVRPARSQIKVGGHQASSASVVTLMTALWFAHLRAPDRVSVKPHASPVLHAINYLLGELDASFLERLREFGGLQSYPSRTKDPDPVDYSTGSVGIGATQVIWGAIAHRYVAGHLDVPRGGRQIALLGDAELDEGAVWEALCDPVVAKLGEVLWIVDLNRQSLDRVFPEIAVGRLLAMFEAAGWHAVTVKYGPRLRALFEREGGADLRRRIDEMPNEEYQRLLRSDPAQLRERLPGSGPGRRAIGGLIAELSDPDLRAAVRDLGGHDLGSVLEGLRECDAVTDRPSILFAYTIKGWGLPIEGHPANHSALLGGEQLAELGAELGADPDDRWARFDPASAQARICAATAERLRREPVSPVAPPALPVELRREHAGEASTQQQLGRLFADLYREAPEAAARVVTVSPDVASSTNLGGWINRVGVWSVGERIDWFADDTNTLVRWRETDHGQHVELGIAEVNLVGLLGELGATWSRDGQPLLPVATIYDPFLMRCFEPWAFGIYAGGQSILIGTPSGVTLGPEGGAHQSVVTPSAGIEQPGCVAWEPAFAQDLEWTFLHALSRLGAPGGGSAYFRLSTRPIDQALAAVPADSQGRERRRLDVLAGGYRLREAAAPPRLAICAVGALVPEALAAATELEAGGAIPTDVLCLTSPDLLFRALRARQGLGGGEATILDRLLPPDRAAPIVGVIDAHPHTLAFLGSVRGDRAAYLGVTEFGQSGDIKDLYPHHGIDAETIVGAALDLL